MYNEISTENQDTEGRIKPAIFWLFDPGKSLKLSESQLPFLEDEANDAGQLLNNIKTVNKHKIFNLISNQINKIKRFVEFGTHLPHTQCW